MSHYDYIISIDLDRQDPPFYSLIMTAMRNADTDNMEKLKSAWPELWDELKARSNAPGGLLDGEE